MSSIAEPEDLRALLSSYATGVSVVNVAAGNFGASASKNYAIGAWFPGHER